MRLFFALELPPATAEDLAAAAAPLRARRGDLRWLDPAGWHLTLAFLGECARETLDAALAAGAAAARTADGAALAGAAFGAWLALPRPGAARLLAAGPAAGSGTWTAAAAAAAAALEAALAGHTALAEEATPRGPGGRPLFRAAERRPFLAHLTVARARSAPVSFAAGEAGRFPPVAAPFSRLVLYASEPRPAGAVYSALGAWTLGRP